MLRPSNSFLVYCLVFLTSSLFYYTSLAKVLEVVAWPIERLSPDKPNLWLAADPVLGRLTCPPLTRLNLANGKAESLIFKEIVASEEGEGNTWKYTLRSGIYWWNGEELLSKDVAHFFRAQIKTIIKEKSSGLWAVPSFNLDIQRDEVRVKWKSKPTFGPYILNGIPLWREAENKQTGLKYECVGTHKLLAKSKDYYELEPSSGYGLKGRILIYKGESVERLEKASASLRLSFPKDLSVSLSNMDQQACRNKLDLPYFTAIIWNHKREQLKSSKFRKLLSSAIPREALRENGASRMASSVSALISRSHPGYNSKLVYEELDTAKIQTSSFASAEKKSKNQPAIKNLTLNMLTNAKNSYLVEKIIEDRFTAIGVSSTWKPFQGGEEGWDGLLSGVYVPDTALAFLDAFHSRSINRGLFPVVENSLLDELLENYIVSESFGKINTQLLKKIHEVIFDLEPISPIHQHKACIEARGLSLPKATIREIDPDWFRSLVWSFLK